MSAGLARRRRARRREKKVGLALGAGGARGLAHIGVLRQLRQAEIPIDAIAGTSSGALIGALFAAGQIENFEDELRNLEWTDVLGLFDPVWPRSGLLSGNRILGRMAGVLGDWKIEDLPIPFVAVCVDLVTGDEVLIHRGRLFDAIRASISIPGIFVPQRRGRRLLVDGALRNPVPVSALDTFDCDVRVAVNVQGTPVRELSAPATDSGPAPKTKRARIGDAIESGVSRFLRRRPKPEEEALPNLFEILTASMSVLEYELARHRLARERVDVVIEPDVHSVRAFEFHRSQAAIAAGEKAAQAALADIERARRRRRVLGRKRVSS